MADLKGLYFDIAEHDARGRRAVARAEAQSAIWVRADGIEPPHELPRPAPQLEREHHALAEHRAHTIEVRAVLLGAATANSNVR